jgi:hypothetical protein
MEHIDAQLLKTDIMYRFQYVCKFMGFTEEDIKVLHDAAPIIAPLVPTVVNTVYAKLHSFDVTWKFFIERNEGFHGKLASNVDELTDEDEQIKFRKNMLSKYLTKLVTAQYDAKFVKYLDLVAKIHTPAGGNKAINVEYIHVNALMGYVEDILLNAVCGLDCDMETKTKVIRAVNKLLWVQNDLFGRWYCETKDAVVLEAKPKPTFSSMQVGITSAVAAVFGAMVASLM